MKARTLVAAMLAVVCVRGIALAQPAIDPPQGWQTLVPPGFTGFVQALYPLENQLVVTGSFTRIGAQELRRAAAWDGSAWTSLAESSGSFESATLFDSRLLVTRGFSEGQGLPRIDAWDGTRWENGAIPSTHDLRRVLAGGSKLFALGTESSAPTRSAPFVSSWNGDSWDRVLTLSGECFIEGAVAAQDGDLLIYGALDSTRVDARLSALWTDGGWTVGVLPTAISDIVWWRGSWIGRSVRYPPSSEDEAETQLWILQGAEWIPFLDPLSGLSASMCSTGDALYLVLYPFRRTIRDSGRLFEVTRDGAIDICQVADRSRSGSVRQAVSWRGDTYFAGNFVSFGDVGTWSVARRHGSTTLPLFQGNGLDDRVVALAPFGSGLAAAGDFRTAGTEVCGGVALFDGEDWSAIAADPIVYVRALQEYRGQLIAAGEAGGDSTTRWFNTTAWTGEKWEPLGKGLQYGSVYDLEVHQGELIAVGDFLYSDREFIRGVAAWNGETWHPLDIGVRGEVEKAESWNGQLVVAGRLTAAGNHDATGIAIWDGYDWAELGGGIPRGPESSINVRDLAVFGDLLIAAGAFVHAGDVDTRGLALWDGVAWRRFAQGDPDHIQPMSIESLLPVGGELWAYGKFLIGRREERGILARWDGQEWHQMLDETGFGAATRLADGRVFLGGVFYDLGYRGGYDFLVQWIPPEVSAAPRRPLLSIDALGPNPARGALDLRYTLRQTSSLRYSLHDVSGRRLVSIEGGVQAAGPHAIHVDAEALSLPFLLSGVYFLRLEAGGDAVSRRIVLVR